MTTNATEPANKAKRYRYVCTCGATGRWLRNPNGATAAAERHADCYVNHGVIELVDSLGKNHGSAL